MPTFKTINGERKVIYSVDELRDMVTFVICHGRRLTDWETSFIRDMDGKDWFSEKQAEHIVRIHAEKTA